MNTNNTKKPVSKVGAVIFLIIIIIVIIGIASAVSNVMVKQSRYERSAAIADQYNREYLNELDSQLASLK